MTAAKNQKRHPLPRLGVFGQPELPTTQAAPGRVRWAALAALLAVCLVCYNYTDLPLIVRHSISLWDALRTPPEPVLSAGHSAAHRPGHRPDRRGALRHLGVPASCGVEPAGVPVGAGHRPDL